MASVSEVSGQRTKGLHERCGRPLGTSLRDQPGVENVMWPIGYPYRPTEPAVEFTDNASLPDSGRDHVSYEKA